MYVKVLQLHKRASIKFEFIQDKFACNTGEHAFSLADGTTQSFRSEKWAEQITELFVKQPSFDAKELIDKFSRAAKERKEAMVDFSTNPAKASLERAKHKSGSTATFMGIQFRNNDFKVISIGDTNLFQIDRGGKISAFPFSKVENLDASNYFLNTEKLLSGEIDPSFFNLKTFDWKREESIVIATDALSRLILEKPQILDELLLLNSFEDFHKFCLFHWEGKDLEEDDISAMIFSSQPDEKFQFFRPPEGFYFPEEEEKEFVPASMKLDSSEKFTDMEMNEIRHQFNGVASDFYKVKKKQKRQEVLLVLVIFLLIANLSFSFAFRADKKTVNSSSNNSNSIEIAASEGAITKEEVGKQKGEDEESSEKLNKEQVKEENKVQLQNFYEELENNGWKDPGSRRTKEIQSSLEIVGVSVARDGKWGSETEKAFKDYVESLRKQK